MRQARPLALVLSALLFAFATAGPAWDQGQKPADGAAADSGAPAAPDPGAPDPAAIANAGLVPGAGAPNDTSSDGPDLAAGLPTVPTEVQMRPGRLGNGKPTAGDVIALILRPAPDQGAGAVPIESKKLETEPVELGDGRILWFKPFDEKNGTITVGVTFYKVGKVKLRGIPFYKDGHALFASEPKEFEFASVGGDKSKDDIYEPGGLPLPTWLVILISLLVLSLVLGLLEWARRWYKKRRSRLEELAKAPRVLTPPEEFEKVRRETESKGHLERATYKPHYFALSEAAKRFLGKAFRFDAEERTTRELLVELERLGMSVDLVDQWERLLGEMDVVKFTDQAPTVDAAKAVAGRLSQVVALSYAKSPVMRDLLMAQQQAQAQSKAKVAK